jgi:hypothetical protein
MRTIEKTVYKFDELSDAAKEVARDWWRDAESADFDPEYIIDDAARLADLIGIDMKQRPVKLMNGSTRYDPAVYWSIDDGASFEASYAYKAGGAAALRKEAPTETELHKIADGLQALQRRHFYRLTAMVETTGRDGLSMRAYASRTDDADVDGDMSDEVESYMTDFAHWIHKRLNDEYEFRLSDDNVDESIRMNEYEFDENGTII